MAHINRFNVVKKIAGTHNSIAWGKNAGVLFFAALLIACSLTVGCSINRDNDRAKSDGPKPSTSNAPIMSEPGTIAASTLPAMPAAKPAPKKIVRKRPATVAYNDKASGVSFDYPRKYAIETGDAANDLVASSPLPLNFIQPGGIALAAVELPETGFANTDFSSAFFNVSVHKALTADQCGEFSVPQPAPAKPSTDESANSVSGTSSSNSSTKLMLGDLELQGTEAVSGEGTRQTDVKYFHAFQNGACYEFALNVTTMARATEAGMKHVDRDKVFARLEQILATVKINPVGAPPAEPTATAEPSTPAASPEAAAQPSTSDVTASTPAAPVQVAPVAPSTPETSPQ